MTIEGKHTGYETVEPCNLKSYYMDHNFIYDYFVVLIMLNNIYKNYSI